MLSVNELSCGYLNVNILKGISFELSQGENLSILGVNGSGKTTLLKAIAGLAPYDGSVKILDKEVSKLKKIEIAKHMAYLSQLSSVYFSYTVFDTVMMGRYVHFKNGYLLHKTKKDVEIVNHCLKKVNIYDIKDKNVDEISGGQLQRVFLARAIAQDPKIILLDEPTNHLDLKNQLELLNYLKQWAEESNKIIIGVFHDINFAIKLGGKALLLQGIDKYTFEETKEVLNSKLINDVYGMDIKKYMLETLKVWED